jgi:hypothetical protein
MRPMPGALCRGRQQAAVQAGVPGLAHAGRRDTPRQCRPHPRALSRRRR